MEHEGIFSTPGDWKVFYDELSAPACEFYDRCAKLGVSLVISTLSKMSSHSFVSEMISTVAAGQVREILEFYDAEVLIGILEELTAAQQKSQQT